METDFEYVSTRHFDRDAWNNFLKEKSEPTATDEAPPQPLDEPHDPRVDALNTAEAFDEEGRMEYARGRYGAARAMHERAMEIRRQTFGEADPFLTRSFTLLGNLSIIEDRLDEAEWLHTQAYRIATKQYGQYHPAAAVVLHNLGVLARRRGDLAAALCLYEHALMIKQECLGDDHPSVAATMANLGNVSRLQGDLRASLAYYSRAREIYESTEGGVSHGLASTLVGMGRVHIDFGVTESAVFMFERALRIREALHVSPAQLAGCRYLLAVALEVDRPAEACALLVSALREYEIHPCARRQCIEAMHNMLHRLSGKHTSATFHVN